MFAVYSCCQSFRLLQLFPLNLTKFRWKWTAWTARKLRFHTDLKQLRSRTSVPVLQLNCTRPNSDQYRFRRECGALEQHVLHRWKLRSELSPSILIRAAVLVIELDRSPWKDPHFGTLAKLKNWTARSSCCGTSNRRRVGGIDSASAWHFEPIFVDFETLDFRIERSCRQF
jgi:hypothetical protein